MFTDLDSYKSQGLHGQVMRSYVGIEPTNPDSESRGTKDLSHKALTWRTTGESIY